MSISHQAAPWNHLYAFDYSGTSETSGTSGSSDTSAHSAYSSTSRNRRNRWGLEITPVHSAYTTAHSSLADTVTPDGGRWQPSHLDDSLKISSISTYGSGERSHSIPCVPRVPSTEHTRRLSNEPSSGISPTSDAQAWPSPPDSGVVFVSSDCFTSSKRAGIAEPYGFNLPETLLQLAEPADQERADLQLRRAPCYEQSLNERTDNYQIGQERRASSDTGYETLDHDMEGLPLYQLDDSPEHRDHAEVKPIGPTVIINVPHPREARIEKPSIEGTCHHFQSDIASSFPPTAGGFPAYWPVKSSAKLSQHSRSSSGPIAFRPAARNSRVNRKTSAPTAEAPLSVIHEYRKGAPNPSPQATRKGRRAGPLSKAKATQAAIIRKNKSVCIRCKMMKQSVGHRLYAKTL